jgi:hypothetical protein
MIAWVRSTLGFQPSIAPPRVTKRKRAGADVVPLLTMQSLVPLNTVPVGPCGPGRAEGESPRRAAQAHPCCRCPASVRRSFGPRRTTASLVHATALGVLQMCIREGGQSRNVGHQIGLVVAVVTVLVPLAIRGECWRPWFEADQQRCRGADDDACADSVRPDSRPAHRGTLLRAAAGRNSKWPAQPLSRFTRRPGATPDRFEQVARLPEKSSLAEGVTSLARVTDSRPGACS